MKHLSESKILHKFASPPGGPPPDPPKPSGSIAVFPTSPLDLPAETFENALKRREENHKKLIQWIKANLTPDVDYGRTHIEQKCRYARQGAVHLCRDFSHMSMLTLWKSGAEKICRLLGLSAHFPNAYQYELACVHRQEIQTVMLKCELRISNGTVVAEGVGSRHIKQQEWNLNATIKMAAKSAMIDATIRAAGLTGVFVKTHQHTIRNNPTVRSGCHCYEGPCSANQLQDLSATQKQIDLIKRLAGRKGLTTESLGCLIQEQFNKALNDLTRVEASSLIQHFNGC